MSLLVEVFGYLAVLLRALALAAQSFAVGGVAFLILLVWPLRGRLGQAGATIAARSWRLIAIFAMALVLIETASLVAKASLLFDSLGATDWFATSFGWAGLLRIALALPLAALALAHARLAPVWRLAMALFLGLALLLAVLPISHAAARLDGRLPLYLLTLAHHLAAAIWIGGLPFLLAALKIAAPGLPRAEIGRCYSLIAMGAVALLLIGGVGLSLTYIASWEALYGTAYGIMVSTKAMLLAMLLVLGGMNFLWVARMRVDPATSDLRLRRFAEIEIGIALTILLAAASITSLPPAVDLTEDRVTWADYAARLAPRLPALDSPRYDELAIAQTQAALDAEAAAAGTPRAQAFLPGSTVPLPRNAADIAWSEYNHHGAGLFVLLIGLLALIDRAGNGAAWSRWARHWPLLFFGLAAFLVVRSEAESWPLGELGLLESLRNPEFLQHKSYVILLSAFGLFEWSVRIGRLKAPGYGLVFPLLTAIGAALLLGHSHALDNVKELLLIEIAHIPIALLGIVAGWARWLELRIDGPARRWASWLWPLCFFLIGLLLLFYREV